VVGVGQFGFFKGVRLAKVDISVGNLVDMIARGELRLPELLGGYRSRRRSAAA
jgi:hypothetical protein